MDDHITISEREMSGICVLDLSGRIDASTSPEVEVALGHKMNTGVKTMILNLTNLGYISSSGLRVILAALKKVKQTGGMIVLADLQPGPAEVFKMTGFDRLFPIYDSVEKATEGLKK